MAQEIRIYGFETSNNMKVRVGLGYKGIPYTFHPIDPKDRRKIIEMSGQHLTPVMVHGDAVLFDSAAILRYLEANFRDTPKLFGSSHGEQWDIEDHEIFARTYLAAPMMEIVHRRVAGQTVDDALMARCNTAFGQAVGRLAGFLDGRSWLVGDRLTAADVTAGAVMHRIRVSGLLELPSAADAIGEWIDRVMAYDRPS